MRYRRDYQETHDIDWFFRYKGNVYHAASNGGVLPNVVDSKKNRELQEKIEEIPASFQVAFEENHRDYYESYEDLSSFEEYAARGFISLDRIEFEEDYEHVHSAGNVEDGDQAAEMVLKSIAICQYHVIARPLDGSFSNDELIKLMPVLGENDIVIR